MLHMPSLSGAAAQWLVDGIYKQARFERGSSETFQFFVHPEKR